MSLVRRPSLLLVVLVLGFVVPHLRADTVYLKNGAWIDGRVRARTDEVVEVEIGKIGKIEISVSEIYEIEKNNRTGEEKQPNSKDEEERIARLSRDAKLAGGAQKTDGTPAKPDTTRADSSKKPEGEGSGKSDVDREGASSPPPPEGKAEDPTLDPQLKARIEELVRDLERQKPQLRTRAEVHLKAIGAPAVPFLTPLAKSANDLTRVAVFRLLSEFGDERAVDACIEALSDPNEYVRDFANRTLERVTQKSFGYVAQASPRRRETAQQKWKKWWEEEKRELEKSRELAGRSSRGGT